MVNSTQVTIYDVAEDAGVSIATVSRLLNTPEKVSKKNREKILASIDKLGFIPKAEARERARKETGRIGVITPFFTVPSFVQRLRGIASALVDTPYELTIYTVDSLARLQGYYAMLPLTHRLDGLIVMSLPIAEAEMRRFKHSKIPVVFIENRVSGLSSVEIDNFQGGKIAAKFFIKKGHTRCAYMGNIVTTDYALRPDRKRLEGYRQHLLANDISLPEEYVKFPSFPPEGLDGHISELLFQDNPPSAIFAASDHIAMNILKFARKKDIRVPEDLAVIGFDNIDTADYLDLTTISQSLDQSGVFAVELLLAQMSDPNRPTQNVNLQLKLIERGTT
jgi:LacI family transcriptional regulator